MTANKTAKIQFYEGTDEPVVPEIRLTRSKDGTTGQALFLFEIIRSESNSLDELIDTYSVFKKEELQESVLRIKKRLGPQRTKIALESINNEKWDLVCRSVLDYYDKCYEYEKVGKTNIKLLDLTDKKYDESILELINNVL